MSLKIADITARPRYEIYRESPNAISEKLCPVMPAGIAGFQNTGCAVVVARPAIHGPWIPAFPAGMTLPFGNLCSEKHLRCISFACPGLLQLDIEHAHRGLHGSKHLVDMHPTGTQGLAADVPDDEALS